MKQGVKAIEGKAEIKAGVWESYTVSEWYPDTPMGVRNEANVKWRAYKINNNGSLTLALEKKEGVFRFGQAGIGSKYKIVAFLNTPELDNASSIAITVVATEQPDIISIVLSDMKGIVLTKPLAGGQIVNAHVNTVGMNSKHKVVISLWEDVKDSHKVIEEKSVFVGSMGVAHAQFIIPVDFKKHMEALMGKVIEETSYHITAYALGELSSAAALQMKAKGEKPVLVEERKKQTQEHLESKTKTKTTTPSYKGKIAPATAKPKLSPLAERGGIKLVYFVDQAGKKITENKTSNLRVIIESEGLIDREINLKLFEDDKYAMSDDDFLFEKNYTLTSNKSYIDITLTKEMQQKGYELGEGWEQELYVKIHVLNFYPKIKSEALKVDYKSHTIDVPDGVSTMKIGKIEIKKEKFDKVKDKGEEAIIYITSEIATAIEVDKKGNVTFYPDYGGYNGQEEYIENEKIYCKKISATQSAFPTYKAYIYRGNVVGEALRKLKQDLEFKTFENAESTVLELARHAMLNNKNYGDSGPIPPNKIENLYELKYQYGVSKKRPSYRYRIVENRNKNKGNFPEIKDITKENTNGSMSIGTRGSISIDPWKSKDLIGCVGLKALGGGYHSSCADRIKDVSNVEKYKFIYHSINNYLESVIPELTGIYGRRGYTSTDEVPVFSSKYDHQTKVFVLVDDLPELSQKGLFNEEDARIALKFIYDKYGEEIAIIVEKMYRLETSHFKSLQYKHCGTGGMEVFGEPPYYGWNSTTYVSHPEHTPIGTWSAMEGKGLSGKGGNTQEKNKAKTFVKLPTVLAGMEYKAEYIERYDGNYARWYNATDVNAQEEYKKSLVGIIPRIVNSFKK